ncbi:MAG TPA: hypothetical protein VF690_00980 [Hymenobacter sp.]
MKKLSLNLSFWLVTLMSVLAGCSKSEITPTQPTAAAINQDAAITGYMVKGYMFLREPGPFGLGHTGVGYEVREMSGTKVTKVYTYCGGVEGVNSYPVIRPGDPNGGWVRYHLSNNVSMLSTMRSYGYTKYKFEKGFRNVSLANLNGAKDMIRYFPNRGYRVGENNCANAVYEVLSWVSAPGLLLPYFNWAPRDQFNKLMNGWSGAVVL